MTEQVVYQQTNDTYQEPVRVQLDPPPFQELLDHIAEIARSAGATLFSFLTVSLYFAVALAAHRDADFFAAGVGTKLPVLGIEIPTELFFLGAPFFILVVFVYLQVYLVKLWFALAAAPEVIPTGDFPNRSLDQATYPWIIIDAVLRWKHSLFRRPLGWLASLGALLVGWLLAPLLIGAFWIRSMPYHHEGLTIVLGVLFWMSVIVAWSSRRLALRVVAGKTYSAGPLMWLVGAPLLALVILLSWSTTEAGLWHGDGRTRLPAHCKSHSLLDGIDCLVADFARNGDTALLVPATLSGVSLSQLPDNYLPRDLAYKDFRHAFIVRQRDEFGSTWREQFPDGKWEPAMEQEFEARRAAQHRSVMRRDLRAADLRRADLSRSDVVAASLMGARLSRANLQWANLEGADLSKADLTYAVVSNAQLASALLEDARLVLVNMYRARMQRARLKRAQLTGSFLRLVDLTGSDLTQVKAERTSFREAKLDDAKLAGVNLTKARLVDASLIRADLRTATMVGADLSKTNLTAANLHSVDLRRATLTNAQLSGAKLAGARFDNATLFRSDLSDADMTGARLKGASLASANLSSVNGLKQLADVFGDNVALSSLPAEVAQPAGWADVPG
ncbi:MAG: pentapeptide repeat-containing protein, partial [Pseudomonadota bacterium]